MHELPPRLLLDLLGGVDGVVPVEVAALSKARLARVSSRPAWGLLVRGSSPAWLTSVRIMIMATMPESSSTMASELRMENQWIWSSPM